MSQVIADEEVRPDMSKVLLEASGVTMRFGGLTAVNKVDFTVHDKEIVGLIGPNGAGKTTFFNCLTGLYLPTSGTVSLCGSVLPPKPRKVVQAGLARTFQNIRLFNQMSALENVMVGQYCRRTAGPLTSILRGPKHMREERETIAYAEQLLHFVGLEEETRTPAASLSYGNQRKLEIARALATQPTVLLLDEPTAGMNPIETEETMNLIKQIRQAGLAVIVIEHDMRFIFNLCDRVVCLVRGEVLVTGTAGEVQSDPRVIEAYIGGALEEEGDE